jgi:serine/threonine protein kinase/formylglycine-generating enzyme required for sulfatase activity
MSEEAGGTSSRALVVFGELCDLPAEEQRQRLASLEAESPALASEVRELLSRDREADERLDEGAAAQLDITGAEEMPGGIDAFAAKVMKRLGEHQGSFSRYEIKGELARGGQGVILRIQDKVLDRQLAMKVILGQGQAEPSGETPDVDSKTLGRFLDEAHVTGKLDHPGIVPVHDLGLDAEGQAYFTMKLVKGKTLKEVFDELASGEGGWTQTRVLGLIIKMCEAMSYAHDKGVIHRDLKPGNVMVGKYGEVYVMDWGLARILGTEDRKDIRVRPEATTSEVRSERRGHAAETPDSPIYTMDGDVVGTPAYMSPEQAQGDLDAIRPHSDVYAAGTMLYHLLAGHMPYVRLGEKASNYAVWRWVRDGPPPSLNNEARNAPAELVAICEKAMAREPADRYRDMSAFAYDLSAYIEGRVVGAYEAGSLAEARKWVKRNRSLTAALTSVLLATVGGLAGAAFLQAEGLATEKALRLEADQKAKEAEDNLVLAQRNEAEARAQRERAERGEQSAKAEAKKVQRLSDARRVHDLETEVDALWPAYPQMISAMERWVREAQSLVSRLATNREALAAMDAPSMDMFFVGVMPRAQRFVEYAWHRARLSELIVKLEAMESGVLAEHALVSETGWSVPKRLAFAKALERDLRDGHEVARAWANASPEIASCYAGLELKPQVGLIPIGRDPDSGLWEFAHLMSGDPPLRKSDGRLDLTEQTGLVLVLIPKGQFTYRLQGDNPRDSDFDPPFPYEIQPAEEVDVAPFFISKYEMTQAQWVRLTGNNPSWRQKGRVHSTSAGGLVLVSLLHPVEGVSYRDTTAALWKLGLKVPDRHEWEYAARAETATPWWTGDDPESLHGAANLIEGDSYDGHAPVGSFVPNGFGLHDVHGNVAEWCFPDDVTRFDKDSRSVYQSAAARGGCARDTASGARISARMSGTGASARVGIRPVLRISN